VSVRERESVCVRACVAKFVGLVLCVLISLVLSCFNFSPRSDISRTFDVERSDI